MEASRVHRSLCILVDSFHHIPLSSRLAFPSNPNTRLEEVKERTNLERKEGRMKRRKTRERERAREEQKSAMGCWGAIRGKERKSEGGRRKGRENGKDKRAGGRV